MGSMIELNDTLRLARSQGFPGVLDLASHLVRPFQLDDLAGQEFAFWGKGGIRVYQQPPVRNFLVEDVDGSWVYWGLCHIRAIEHDYVKRVTSGRFVITHLNSPEEMRDAFDLVDRVEGNNYFTH